MELRVRYPRELRGNPDDLKILCTCRKKQSLFLWELVDIRYEQGPQVIKNEATFNRLCAFDKLMFCRSGWVESAQALFKEK